MGQHSFSLLQTACGREESLNLQHAYTHPLHSSKETCIVTERPRGIVSRLDPTLRFPVREEGRVCLSVEGLSGSCWLFLVFLVLS